MPTHPFAIKLAEAVKQAKRALEGLRRSKKSAEDAPVPGLPRKVRRSRHVQLGALAASGMERQAVAEAGFLYDKGELEKGADQEMRRLQIALAKEEGKCAQMRARAKAATGREVSVACPGVTAALDALQRYMDNKHGGTGASPRGR
jgi:hypothetical protein